MIKGMKKDGYWYKIEDISKINADAYLRFEVTACDMEELMKVLSSKKETKKSTQNKPKSPK